MHIHFSSPLPTLIAVSVLAVASGCGPRGGAKEGSGGGLALPKLPQVRLFDDPVALNPHPRTAAEKIVNGAKQEVRRGVVYDAAYVPLQYPGGDVPADRGACTDVVVRALRHAGYDLQKLIHEDMRRNFGRYPKRYGLRRPDRNIDHRRTPNHMTFLRRFGKSLPREYAGAAAESWQPGDLVYCNLANGLGHCGVVSDRRTPEGRPLILHNAGRAELVDLLPRVEVTGHFRYPMGR